MTTVTDDKRATPPTGAAYWVRKNLFRSPLDGAITVVFGSLSIYLLFRAVMFVFVNARWEIIRVNLKLLLVGRWPSDELAVLAISFAVLGIWGGMVAGIIAGRQRQAGTSEAAKMTPSQRTSDLVRRFGLIIATILLLLLLTTGSGPWLAMLITLVGAVSGYWLGRMIGSRRLGSAGNWALTLVMLAIPVAIFFYMTSSVPLAEWEGFMFNLTSAAAGIALSFPIGVLLALARRSKLPLLKSTAIVYIEFVRGSPLFVLLLLANVSLEFFVPEALAPSKVVRAIVTFTVFSAAYIAEIVRGGLQSVPNGQSEAAKALGLSPYKQTSLIILPQALRAVIPAQIGQFIALFKDTTLAGVALGILDLLNGAGAITQQPDFRGQGLIIEALVFVAFLFWVGSFTMSRESQRLEKKLGVGIR